MSIEVPDEVGGVRRALQALRAELDKNPDRSAEDDAERMDRLKGPFEGLVNGVLAFHEKSLELKNAPGTNESTKEALDVLRGEIVHDAFGDSTGDSLELIAALVDTDGNIDLNGNWEEQLLNLESSMLSSEEKAFRAYMTVWERTYESVERFMGKIPGGIKDGLEALGLDMDDIVATVMGFIAEYADGVPFLRNWSMSLREGEAVRRASNQWDKHVDVAIRRGRKKWENEYKNWMKKDPANAGPHPDLFEYIETEMEAILKEEAEKEIAEKNRQLKAEFEATNPFGPDIAVDVQDDATYKATKDNAGSWKVIIPFSGFEKDEANNVFTLRAESELLKAALNEAIIKDSGITTLGIEHPLRVQNKQLDVKLGNDVTIDQVSSMLTLAETGKNIQVMVDEDGANGPAYAVREQGGLFKVNAAALNDTAALDSLKTAIHNSVPADTAWKVENGSWVPA